MEINPCLGCRDLADQDYRNNEYCFVRAQGTPEDVINCPCRECLVKVMCKLGCDTYAILSEKVELNIPE